MPEPQGALPRAPHSCAHCSTISAYAPPPLRVGAAVEAQRPDDARCVTLSSADTCGLPAPVRSAASAVRRGGRRSKGAR
jgi:hypothetical protein